MTTHTLPTGEVVDATWADAAGPDSRLHLNGHALFARRDGGPWWHGHERRIPRHRLAEWLAICDCWADVVDAFDLTDPEPTR